MGCVLVFGNFVDFAVDCIWVMILFVILLLMTFLVIGFICCLFGLLCFGRFVCYVSGLVKLCLILFD